MGGAAADDDVGDVAGGEKDQRVALSRSVYNGDQRTRAHLGTLCTSLCTAAVDCTRRVRENQAESHGTVWRVDPRAYTVPKPTTAAHASIPSRTYRCRDSRNCYAMVRAVRGGRKHLARLQIRYSQASPPFRRQVACSCDRKERLSTRVYSAALVDARIKQSRRFPVVLRHLVRVLRAIGPCLLDKVEQDKVRVGLVLQQGESVKPCWGFQVRGPLAAVGAHPVGEREPEFLDELDKVVKRGEPTRNFGNLEYSTVNKAAKKTLVSTQGLAKTS